MNSIDESNNAPPNTELIIKELKDSQSREKNIILFNFADSEKAFQSELIAIKTLLKNDTFDTSSIKFIFYYKR